MTTSSVSSVVAFSSSSSSFSCSFVYEHLDQDTCKYVETRWTSLHLVVEYYGKDGVKKSFSVPFHKVKFHSPGEVVEGARTGGQHFGSGGYSAGSTMRNVRVISQEYRSNSFINEEVVGVTSDSDGFARFSAFDCIGEGRSWEEVHIWTTDGGESLRQCARAYEAGRKFVLHEKYGEQPRGEWIRQEAERKRWIKRLEQAQIEAACENERVKEIFMPPAKPLRDKRPVPVV